MIGDPHLLVQLTVECGDEALSCVHGAARQQPVLASAGLLVPAEQDAILPAQDGRDADAGLLHQWLDDPTPRTPRSLSGSASTSTGSTLATGTPTSCAMRMPGSTTNSSCASVLSSTTRSSPR